MKKSFRKSLKESSIETLSISELGELAGVRYATIKHFTALGLIPYYQEAPGYMKLYPRDIAIARVREIQELKNKGQTLTQIVLSLADFETIPDPRGGVSSPENVSNN